MAISSDGTQFVLLNQDTEAHARVFDLSSGREVRSVKLSDKRIDSISFGFTADGRVVAAGVVEKHLKLWDVTAKKEQELGLVSKEYPQLKFSRDGRLLALSENYIVKIWDAASGRELTQLKVPNSGAFNAQADAYIAFSDDGKRMATGGFDTDTIVWETDTGKRVSNLTGRTNMAYNVAFSPDGTQLLSGGRTRWDLRTGRGLRLVAASSEKTYGVPSPDGRVLAVRPLNGNVVKLVEAPSGKELFQLVGSGEVGVVQQQHFSADGSLLAVVYGPSEDRGQAPATATSFSRGSQVKIWDVKTGRELQSVAANSELRAALPDARAHVSRRPRRVRQHAVHHR
jgi:WD40 repeat protein